MSLSFRSRILWFLILLGALPTTALVIGWALTIRGVGPSGETATAISAVSSSGRALLESIDTTAMSSAERELLSRRTEELNEALGRAERSFGYMSYYSAGLAVAILVVGSLLVYGSVLLAGHLSRQLSRPIGDLVGWTDRIRRGQPLPTGPPPRGAPEFETLRDALRSMNRELAEARGREIEAERLRAFREVARRVAHEMKNPLTPIRFAVAQLQRNADESHQDALDVIALESARLEHLPREFTEFGRLPQGPPAEVDIHELLGQLGRTAVPHGMRVETDFGAGDALVTGYFDPLHRAFSNLILNAVEATGGSGLLRIATSEQDGALEIAVSDDGPGIPVGERELVFDPYVTGKEEGTGLGLAMVRQTVSQHGGSVSVDETPGGGATFKVTLPRRLPDSPDRPSPD